MSGLAQYRAVDAVVQVQDASPHRLIQLMFEGLLGRLAIARGQMERRDYQGKGQSIGKAVAIVGALQDCLDVQRGGDLAANLDALYNYVQQRLFTANVQNDPAVLDEIAELVGRVKSGWDAIEPGARGR